MKILIGRKIVIKVLSFIFVVSLFISCSAPKKIEDDGFDIRDVIKQINNSSKKIKSLKGAGNISLENESGANSGSFKINLLKPDSISLSITGPFGINVAKALITRDSFLFHDSFNNVAVKGKTTKRNISEIFKLNIDFDDILSVLSCSPDFFRESNLEPQIDLQASENEAVIIYQKEGDIIKYYLNLENKYISKRVVYSGSGKIISEENYQSYYKKDNMWLPRSIKIVLPYENQLLSLYFEKQEINTDNLSFNFTIPKDTKILNWRENN